MTKQQERPVVSVFANTVNSTSVKITTDEGTAWLNITHGRITVKSEGLEVEVKP